jgi:hypothetical protein
MLASQVKNLTFLCQNISQAQHIKAILTNTLINMFSKWKFFLDPRTSLSQILFFTILQFRKKVLPNSSTDLNLNLKLTKKLLKHTLQILQIFPLQICIKFEHSK